jgi:hypothetical protein
MTNNPTQINEETLIAKLSSLGLQFVIGESKAFLLNDLTEVELIAGLVQQSDARLRTALIALFLYRPDLETAVSPALSTLAPNKQIQLKIYYTAAMLLQRIHEIRLKQLIPYWHWLPNHFAKSLKLDETDSPTEQLRRLGHQHREISGVAANWAGTYQFAAQRLITRLEKEAVWAA